MTGLLNISFKRNNILQAGGLLAAGYLLPAAIGLNNYLSFVSSGFLLGMIALPMVLQLYTGRPKSYRYAWITIASGLLCFFNAG